MKTIKTLIFFLVFTSLQKNLYCITEMDVRCFGEDDTFCDVVCAQSEHDRYRIITAECNRRLKKQNINVQSISNSNNNMQSITKKTRKPIAITQQNNDTCTQNKNSIAQSPDSINNMYFATSWKNDNNNIIAFNKK